MGDLRKELFAATQQARPQQPMLPLIGPIRVPPHPVPTDFAWLTFHAPDGKRWVVLQINTATGVQQLFLDARCAKDLSEGMATCAAEAESGLVVPR